MAPALAPGFIGREAAACALLGSILGSVRALFPRKGTAAFVPDLLWVGALLLGLQSYAAALSFGGVVRWYMAAAAVLCAFGAETLLRPLLEWAEQLLLTLLRLPLCLMTGLTEPLRSVLKARKERRKAAREQKRAAKKPKKNLPTTQRMLYNSNVSK